MGRPRVLVLEILTGASGRGWFDRRVRLPGFFGVMAQAVAVWAEDLGCEVDYRTYTGNERLRDLVSGRFDVAFLSAYTRASYAAYALSGRLRALGAVTALGGPHAVSYPQDSARFFDYVLGSTDRETVGAVIDERRSAGSALGRRLAAPAGPSRLPGLSRRRRFLDAARAKARLLRVVTSLASTGCPFECEFCSDAEAVHRPLPLADIEEDVRFAAEQYPNDLFVWIDPNFGVALDPLLEAIDRARDGRKLRFAAQSSLSLLGRERLERLARTGFQVLVPGLESWFACAGKLGPAGRLKGPERVRAAASSVNEVLDLIPYVQVNFVFGLEGEPVSENFALTKEFLHAAPGAWPTFNLLTAWGTSSPLSRRLHADGRVLPLPFPLLDQKSCSNVIRPDGSSADLYRGLTGLEEAAFGPSFSWRRARRSSRWEARIINVVRGRGAEMRQRLRWYRRLLDGLEHDRDVRAFFEGEPVPIPSLLRDRAIDRTGPFLELLPPEILDELKTGRRRPAEPALSS